MISWWLVVFVAWLFAGAGFIAGFWVASYRGPDVEHLEAWASEVDDWEEPPGRVPLPLRTVVVPPSDGGPGEAA